MVWILEAMQLDNPLHAIPLARCWDLHRRYPDEHTAKRHYDMQKHALDRYRREVYTPARVRISQKLLLQLTSKPIGSLSLSERGL